MGLSLTKLINGFFFKNEVRILMVGLDFAGKTTILYKLKLDETVETFHTIGYNVEKFEYKDTSFALMDVSRMRNKKSSWEVYFRGIQGVIYVVDSSAKDKMDDARHDLHEMLNHDDLRNTALLVYANKQDLPDALTATEITGMLDLQSITQRKWYIQSACALSGDGLSEGLDWLSNNTCN